jgi:predicted nucleic acid-binding protein
MKYVIDSSVAVKWAIPETDTSKALQLREDFRNGVHHLLAPDVFAIEAAHALTRAERQKRISVGESKVFLTDILKTAPLFHPFYPLLLHACDISSIMRAGVYDCLYVSLAEQEGCEFVTADDKLVKNLQRAYPFIKALASLP